MNRRYVEYCTEPGCRCEDTGGAFIEGARDREEAFRMARYDCVVESAEGGNREFDRTPRGWAERAKEKGAGV